MAAVQAALHSILRVSSSSRTNEGEWLGSQQQDYETIETDIPRPCACGKASTIVRTLIAIPYYILVPSQVLLF